MKKLFITTVLAISSHLYCQVGIGTAQPHPSAILEASSNNKGFLPPRLTTAQRDSIQNPAPGLMLYNTDTDCLHYWDNSSWAENCGDTQNSGETGVITSLACLRTAHQGALNVGYPANGASSTIPYIGGNGGNYNVVSVNSTGVTGLTATLLPGNLTNGEGVFVFNITGTPSSIGMATFEVKILGHTCTFSRPVLDEGDNKFRIAGHGLAAIGNGGFFKPFTDQLKNPDNYGPTGVYNKIDGFAFFDITNGMLPNLTGAQLKIGYDIINAGATDMTKKEAQNLKDYADLGGVLIINFTNGGAARNLIEAFGISTTYNTDGRQYIISDSVNSLNDLFGDTRNVELRASSTSVRFLTPELPAGSVSYAKETPAGSLIPPYNTTAAFTLGGYGGRVICIGNYTIFTNASNVAGADINTNQERYIHNIMAYAIDKAKGL